MGRPLRRRVLRNAKKNGAAQPADQVQAYIVAVRDKLIARKVQVACRECGSPNQSFSLPGTALGHVEGGAMKSMPVLRVTCLGCGALRYFSEAILFAQPSAADPRPKRA